MREILHDIKEGKGVTAIREGQEPNITTQRSLMRNLKQCVHLPPDKNYSTMLIWLFRDYLSIDPPCGRLHDLRGLQNGIFYAFGFGSELTWETTERLMKVKWVEEINKAELKLLEDAANGVCNESGIRMISPLWNNLS